MALSAEDKALLTTRLTSAESALHDLMIGNSVRVFVDENGERIEYSAANIQRLRAYIWDLKQQLGKITITGPMQIWF